MLIPAPVPPHDTAAAAVAADFAVVTDWPAKASSDPGRNRTAILVLLLMLLMLSPAVPVTTAAVLAEAEMGPVIDFASSRIPFV